MSPRRKTEPPTRVSSRSAHPGRSGLIAKGKPKSNQQRRGPPLTIAFIERLLKATAEQKSAAGATN
jgi:hypothetical protein